MILYRSRIYEHVLFMNTLMDEQIVQLALENLLKNSHIMGKWEKNVNEIDGKITFQINGENLVLNTEIKKELSFNHFPKIEEMVDKFQPFLVVARRIIPRVKAELRKKQIAYLEGNGNIYLKEPGIFLWIDTHKTFPAEKEKPERAFTKTGLKVIFSFLIEDELINRPYREIAEITEVALGAVHKVMTGLRELKYLIKTGKTKFKIINKNALINKWFTTYNTKFRPTLLIGKFRFLKEEDFINWKRLKLAEHKTFWGGEPAGDLLTNYLRPAELTIYTSETRNEVIKNYHLVPDEKGKVLVYQKFWNTEVKEKNTVPPLLIYTDLMNTEDMRCIETAKKVYEQHLRN